MLKPVEPLLIDWFYVLLDIQRKGYTPATIGMAIDVPRTTILGWRDLHANPRHIDGEKLIALWCSVTGNTRETLPKATALKV
ncbi:hypothetical protein DBR37_01650 [Herminiimonas sp. KBW02]|uniref:hypothetical protein n=1 Tax=Herminiimonas sp. KBW02 TaxID=2153363 RepID=UPI000F5AF7CC|nr:hypothetical protein [Herminiimonas sp. KBW02]RQO38625.1 hypothetical protein DBR37_01650 [Herminiimonas sp. KBW02]